MKLFFAFILFLLMALQAPTIITLTLLYAPFVFPLLLCLRNGNAGVVAALIASSALLFIDHVFLSHGLTAHLYASVTTFYKLLAISGFVPLSLQNHIYTFANLNVYYFFPMFVPFLARTILYPAGVLVLYWYYTPDIEIPRHGKDISEHRVARAMYKLDDGLPFKVDSVFKIERLKKLQERLMEEMNLMDKIRAYKRTRKGE